MFKVLENNSSLTSLYLSENEIKNINVFKVLENNSLLVELNLEYNKYNIDTFEEIFTDILQKNITLTDLFYDFDDLNDYDSDDY